MKQSMSFFICGLLIGAILSAGGFALYVRSAGSISSDVKVLKLGHSLDTNHPVHIAMEYMGKRLEEISGGKMSMTIYPSSTLGSEPQCIEQLRDGSLAMTKTSAAAAENFENSYSVFGLPYLFRSPEHYWKVLESSVGKKMLDKALPTNLKGLCYYDSGSRNFYTVDKPIKTPDDLAGMKIRVMNSKTAMDMVKTLGGNPTPIAWGELYTALAQGTVEGAENNPPSFTSNKHYEVCKHFSFDGHTMIPDILWIGTKVWEKLSPQEQKWVQQAADESSVYQRDLWKKMTAESVEQAKEEGVHIYEVDTKLFAEKVQPMYDAITDEEIKKLIKEIREIK